MRLDSTTSHVAIVAVMATVIANHSIINMEDTVDNAPATASETNVIQV